MIIMLIHAQNYWIHEIENINKSQVKYSLSTLLLEETKLHILKKKVPER